MNIDQTILMRIGLYRILEPRDIACLFGDIGVGRVRILAKQGLLKRNRVSRLTLLQLTQKGAREAGLSAARGRNLKEQALLKHFGILRACMRENALVRLEDDELAELLGDELPSAAHCLGKDKETPTIFQSYVPGPRTRVETVTRKLQREISLSRSSPELNRYIDNRRYGFLVLVHNEERKTKIERVLRRRSGRSSVPLVRQALIRVDVVPELEEVALCGQA